MIDLDFEQIAATVGIEVLARGSDEPAASGSIDSRSVGEDQLFFGLVGANRDGGEFAAEVVEAGCWGVLARPEFAEAALAAARTRESDGSGPTWVLSATDPLVSLQLIGREARRALAAKVVAITGSTGKTSVKDLCRSLIPGSVHASHENFNTEIGMPLSIFEAPTGTEVLVLEMGMRGRGQIAELCAIAEPDVAVITNIGPVHLELLGSIEAIADTKAEILAGLLPGGTAVVPVSSPLLEPHLQRLGGDVRVLRFGEGGDVAATSIEANPTSGGLRVEITTPAGTAPFEFPFDSRHNVLNACAAVAAGLGAGAEVEAMAELAPGVVFSRLRGERVALAGDITVINDCYNANPVSVRASLEHLASVESTGRRIAVLGGMAELGPTAPQLHAEAAAAGRALGIEHLFGVGDLARDYDPDQWFAEPESAAAELVDWLEPGDTVLVKGSRSVGLERLTDELLSHLGAAEGGGEQ